MKASMDMESRNVNTSERFVSVLAGGGLLFYGLSRRTLAGAGAAAAGATLLYRGATGHCPMYAALDRSPGAEAGSTKEELSGSGGVHVKESITINREPSEIYRYWRQLENLPQFMHHLKRVDVIDARRSHWVARAPARTKVEWDAEIINEVENELIGWQSLPGSQVVNAGSVRFERAPGDRGTVVTVHLQYDPPGGKVGAAVAKLFGEEPSQQIADDLRRLKQLLEAGEIITTEHQPSGRSSMHAR